MIPQYKPPFQYPSVGASTFEVHLLVPEKSCFGPCFVFVGACMPFLVWCVQKATFHDEHNECVYHFLIWDGMVNVLGVHHTNVDLGDTFFETVCWCPLSMHEELVVCAFLLIVSLVSLNEEVYYIKERCIWVTKLRQFVTGLGGWVDE